jgi:hypothetical protein
MLPSARGRPLPDSICYNRPNPTRAVIMSDSTEIDWTDFPDVERIPGKVSGSWPTASLSTPKAASVQRSSQTSTSLASALNVPAGSSLSPGRRPCNQLEGPDRPERLRKAGASTHRSRRDRASAMGVGRADRRRPLDRCRGGRLRWCRSRVGANGLIFIGNRAESRAPPILIFVGVELVFSGKPTDICRVISRPAFPVRSAH